MSVRLYNKTICMQHFSGTSNLLEIIVNCKKKFEFILHRLEAIDKNV